MNLHHIVRGAITSVHPDETALLYRANGQDNVKGKVKARYEEPETIKGNFQAMDALTLQQLERGSVTGCTVQAYLYSDIANPVSGISRIPITRTGDFIKRSDDTWWLVHNVIEDWSADGWIKVGLTRQVTPPEVEG